jgi:hypothetical protein
LEIRANRVRLGIEAPSGVSVLRGELLCRAETQEADDHANGNTDQGNGHGQIGRSRPNGPAIASRPWAVTARERECASS